MVNLKFSEICRVHHIRLAYLFGSYAEVGYQMLQGEKFQISDPLGDVDLGLLFQEGRFPQNIAESYADLYCKFEDFFSPLRLDLVFLQQTDSFFQFQAINGICVWMADEEIRSDYEEQVVKYASDWKFQLDLYYKEMLEELQEGRLYAEL